MKIFQFMITPVKVPETPIIITKASAVQNDEQPEEIKVTKDQDQTKLQSASTSADPNQNEDENEKIKDKEAVSENFESLKCIENGDVTDVPVATLVTTA